MQKLKIKKILEEYFAGKLSPELNEQVRGWLSSKRGDPEVEEALETLSYGYIEHREPSEEAYKRLKTMHEILGFDKEETKEPEVIQPRRRIYWRVAAAVLVPVLVALGATFLYISDKGDSIHRPGQGTEQTLANTVNDEHDKAGKEVTISVLGGNHKLIVLADGTEVTLNEKSKLTYGDNRTATLEGEAFFKVAKSDKPFIIHTDCIEVTVLGTEFNLNTRQNAQNCEVELYSGKVRLDSESLNYQLEAGREFIFDKQTEEMSVASIPPGKTRPQWFEAVMNFDGRTLNEILQTVQSYYGVTIDYDDRLNTAQHYSFRFNGDETVEQVMTVLQTVSGEFTYRIEQNRIILELIN